MDVFTRRILTALAVALLGGATCEMAGAAPAEPKPLVDQEGIKVVLVSGSAGDWGYLRVTNAGNTDRTLRIELVERHQMQALHHHTIMVCVPAKSTISGVEDAKLVFSALLVNPDVVEGSLSVTMYPGPSLPATPACPGAALTEG